jgi:diguanylate cyclase (GGDEF)-like protein
MDQRLVATRKAAGRYTLLWAALGTVGLHFCLGMLFPQSAWITPTAWIAMYTLAFAATLRECRHVAPEARWRWRMVAINFSFSIVSFLCILYSEYLVPNSAGAAWLNDLRGTYRGLPLLLVLCAPEDADRRTNRFLDIAQTVLIALIFFVLFSPALLQSHAGGLTPLEASLVNRYGYTQSTILALLALLAVFTAKTADSRLFHRVLALYLWIGVPIGIWTNHFLVNTWVAPPASATFTLSDLCLLAYIAAVPLLGNTEAPQEPGRRLVFLRLAASAFLPLFGILASMLLAVAGHHPVLGIATGVISLALYGIRSTYGQFELLSVQWNLQAINERLEVLSQRDPLTGLYNRRWFSERFALEWRRAQLGQLPISLLMLDVDHFKLFNDTQGHTEGDACLQTVSTLLAEQLHRGADALVRYGGEEFVALLPNTDSDGAHQVVQKVMSSLAELRLPHPASPFGEITVSIGGVTWRAPDVESTPEQMILLADAALYQAKERGRNCVHLVNVPTDPD